MNAELRLAPAAPTPLAAPRARQRMESIDLVRGLVRVSMALDGWRRLRFATAAPGSGPGTPGGHDLPVVYAVWALVILMIYPVCARYAAYKRAHPRGWARYF
jgi:hypothetical protein